MSKSEPSEQSRINLTDDADAIAQKVRRAKTDPLELPDSVKGLEGRPEAENLLGIYAALTDKSLDAVVAEFAGAQFSTFKGALADIAVAVLSPITAEMNRLMADPAAIDAILRRGADRAGAIAQRHIREIYDLVGFLRP
jgi:tryptophanyl-tRNA synthetase